MALTVGVIGCGNICDVYVRNAQLFRDIEVTACADIAPQATARVAGLYGLRGMTVEDLLADPDIDIVLNLTSPTAHAEVSLAAIAAGKHVYSEKPLAISLEDGRHIIEAARVKGVRVGCAPDTFLGGGIQQAKAIIDSGEIGQILLGTAAVMGRGGEHWHPNPGFIYAKGGGPILDLGPYYISALAALLGPIEEVTARGMVSPIERRYGAEGPLKGKVIDVEVYTTVQSILHFASGIDVTFIASWDVWNHSLVPIELHGSVATIRVPDPDTFGGAVQVSGNRRPLNVHDPRDAEELATFRQNWITTETFGHRFGRINYPFDSPNTANYRGLGLADMAAGILGNRPHRCSGGFAFHVLAAMIGILESAESGQRRRIVSDWQEPEAFLGAEPERLLK